MSWLGRGSRLAAVTSAAFLIAATTTADAATTTADASRGRLTAVAAEWLAHGRLITFRGHTNPYDTERTWIMNSDGSGKRPLRGDAPSPSGRRLATSGDTGTEGVLWIDWLSGKTIRNFTIHVVANLGFDWPVWAPDERAVEVGVDDATMFVAELRGGLHSISHIRSREDMSPWSPDSRSIAFITCAKSEPWKCDLARIGRNGSGRKVLVRNIISAAQRENESGVDVQPVWAPNGRAITFAVKFGDVRERKAPRPRHGTVLVARYGIYVVRPDGTGLRRVAATPYMETELSVAPALAWSRNSRRIAFVDTRGITIVDISDGSQHRLTSLPRDVPDDNDVSWAPSTRVLFAHRGNLYTALPGQRPLRILP